MVFPGGRVPFTSTPQFIGGVFDTDGARLPCYRTLDGTGKHIEEAVVPHELSQEQATTLYVAMAKLQVMDTICYDAQRQVRPSLWCIANALRLMYVRLLLCCSHVVACHIELRCLLCGNRLATHG
jgi:hypothetical protein